ncbi:MAG: phosphoribosylformimino-5-aminoimidazole carboxamide ribotide isomerase, partial [Chitinivibrionales bacterium]|nr:phosphoribosylformimino-5-aminoimidazole carboxamide ribotide isomerase [Chitinivibrionales bacterium]MBD3394049.1 phosphoribosylformimino-5-aminoimidazole carboxamide ribotide isomerase [Chitinivibrionales bacterium]
DLHQGKVKQIVGSSLSDRDASSLITNFETERSPAEFARMYRDDGLAGGHVIMLGPGNEAAAEAALAAYPGGLQVGGGITPATARSFLDKGASHVIVTSYVFREGRADWERLAELAQAVGSDRLVIDLSCKAHGGRYVVATDRWQHLTGTAIDRDTLGRFAGYCAEFLVHAADVEGRRRGVDAALVALLGDLSPVPVTYAGGIRSIADLEIVKKYGGDRVDATVGSALDIYGGSLKYRDVVVWHARQNAAPLTSSS